MNRRAHILLPLLLLVSGFCGISYEILYTKLLGNLLGNQFTINATVLLTFLLGIGLGTLYAHRFVRWLWAIEAGIGIYAGLMVAAYDGIDRLLYTWMPALGTSLPACALAAVMLLSIPAFLVGCSVPLFAAYLSTLRSTHVFSTTYGLYNFGAALTAVTLEFGLLRWVGLRSATLWLATLNVLVALGLLLLVRRAPLVPAPRADRLWFGGRELTALALASVASAIFQLSMIKLAECVLGPFNETFALVLATVLLGLALGALVVGRFRLTFSGAILLALAGLVGLLGAYPLVATAYAASYAAAVDVYPLLVLLKWGFVFVLAALPAIGFGATIPALLRVHRDVARESGQLLFVSSMANVLGFFMMAFVLHRYLDYGVLVLVIVGFALAGLLVAARGRRVTAAGLLLAAAAVGVEAVWWDEGLLYYGHENFQSTRRLERTRGRDFSAERFKGYQDVFAITRSGGNAYFFINGYISIPLTAVAEKVAGALSAMFAPRLDDALVLGIGSGATAGTIGLIFDRTEAVEINAVILDNLHRMSEYNFDLEHQPRVEIIHDDGIHHVKTATKRYSLIVNTVTTPIYFSSSKLYTRDFLRAVRQRLKPDGVYTTWVDQDLGDGGIDIILETLDEAFETCWLAYLKSSYYLLVCSDAEIAPHQLQPVVGQPELVSYFAEREQLATRMLPYSLLSTAALAIPRGPQARVNTVDFPVLEHEMARRNASRIVGFNARLAERLDLQAVRAALEPAMDWSPAEFALWAQRRLNTGVTLDRMLDEAVRERYGDLGRYYEEAALAVAREIGTADAFYEYGTHLVRRDRCGGALEALTRAVELDPKLGRARYYIGRCHERLGDPARAREMYRDALSLDPDDEDARDALERVTAAGGAEGS